MKHTPEAKARIRAAALARYAAVPLEERVARERERVKRWHADNPERVREIKRAWYERNREALNAKAREKNRTPSRRAYMRTYAPQHRAANRDLYATYAETRRARECGAPGTHTEAQWLGLLAACGGVCVYCKHAPAKHRDHAIPLSRGGTNDISNIRPACGSCNSAKGTLTEVEFFERVAGVGPAMDARWAAQLAAAQERGRKSRWA